MCDIDIKTYPSGLILKFNSKNIFIPYKSIELVCMEKKDGGWSLFIKAAGEKYNLLCANDITEEFNNICIMYKG
jgi:hypothetical protein